MEFVFIVFIVILFLGIRSFRSKGFHEKKQSKSYKDYDLTKRSSPHPNDTVLGKAEPKKLKEKVINEEDAWNKIIAILGDVSIMGTYYRTSEEIFRVENLQIGEELFLVREPSNNFDRNAIKVTTRDHFHIGYIPKELCRMFNDILVGCKYRVLVNKIVNAPNAPYVHVKVEILDE